MSVDKSAPTIETLNDFDFEDLAIFCFDNYSPVYEKLHSGITSTDITSYIEVYQAGKPIPSSSPPIKQLSVEHYFSLGFKAFVEASDLWEARRYFEMVLEIDPYYPRAREWLEDTNKLIDLQKHPLDRPPSVGSVGDLTKLKSAHFWPRLSVILVFLFLLGIILTIYFTHY